jgi:hypothetical protein
MPTTVCLDFESPEFTALTMITPETNLFRWIAISVQPQWHFGPAKLRHLRAPNYGGVWDT